MEMEVTDKRPKGVPKKRWKDTHLRDSVKKAEGSRTTKRRLSHETLELIRQHGAARAAGNYQLTSELAKWCREAIREDLMERRAAVLSEAAEAGRSIRNTRRDFANRKTKMTALRRPDGTITSSRRVMEKVIYDFYSDFFDSHVHLPSCHLREDEYVISSVLPSEVRHAIKSTKDSHASKQGFGKDPLRSTIYTPSREYKMPFCLTFIDLKKAFDTVETEAVLEALGNEAERMLADFDDACGKIGLQLNLTKTMLMANGWVPDAPFSLNGNIIFECSSYVYLGREVNMMNDLAPELGRVKRAAWEAYKSIEDVVKKTKNIRLRAHLFNTTLEHLNMVIRMDEDRTQRKALT
ncbi:hypothetical protein ANCCEY_06032 [Ancylostoma ceylanicum]|uniref:Reverse transcriptase domain-containing protein n=1 Tax=Ancylostoma ceylanicum TaxID=53326 RepID=A0A0D6M4Q7_9BILA|nr:hypothetical protein ANCCEY_06032 [Ancylostoma ceylanicum]